MQWERGPLAPTPGKRSDYGGETARMEADGARAPRELTATAAASPAGARKEGACAARRGVSSGTACPAPPSGPAHEPGVASAVPERLAGRQLQTLTDTGPWKPPPPGASLGYLFIPSNNLT